MIEIAPDAPDEDDYEVEIERVNRHRKRMADIYEQEERRKEEERDAGN